MDFLAIMAQMDHTAAAIAALAAGLSDEQARQRPAVGEWSVLEVINHLWDEEIEDFRTHLDQVLHRPGEPWRSIDPMGWVTARGYNQRTLGPSLAGFMAARRESLDWLNGLAVPDWESARAASWGTLRAGDLLASWAAHDLLHLRQLVALRYGLTVRLAAPYGVFYAGPWEEE